MAKICDLGFANVVQAARVNSLTIADSGLRAKGRLSFKTGVFGTIELLKAARRALWDKTKTQSPGFEKKLLKLSRLLSPKSTKRDTVLLGGTRLETAPKTGCNWNDRTAKLKPSSENNIRTLSRGSFRSLFFYPVASVSPVFTQQTCKSLDFLFREGNGNVTRIWSDAILKMSSTQ